MEIVIGTRAWSTWSLRPWLYLKQQGIAFEERRVPLFEFKLRAELASELSGSRRAIVLVLDRGSDRALTLDDGSLPAITASRRPAASRPMPNAWR